MDSRFDEPTGAALIFDTGSEGAIVLDIDTGATAHFRLPRGDVEDQPFPLLRRGELLVVAEHGGWMVAPADGPGVSIHSLGDGDYAIPAAETDQVWLVDEHGGREGTKSVWTLVDTTGHVQARVEVDEDFSPIRGVPGGLAFHDEGGAVIVYDIAPESSRRFLEEGAHVLDATADRVITCQEPCEALAVRDERREVVSRLGTEGVRGYDPEHAWLSADGQFLAVRASMDVAVDGSDAVDLEIHVYDVAQGQLLDRMAATLGGLAGSWTLDNEQFYYRTVIEGPPSPLWRYRVGEGFEVASLDDRDAPRAEFVAFSRERLEPLLADNGDDAS